MKNKTKNGLKHTASLVSPETIRRLASGLNMDPTQVTMHKVVKFAGSTPNNIIGKWFYKNLPTDEEGWLVMEKSNMALLNKLTKEICTLASSMPEIKKPAKGSESLTQKLYHGVLTHQEFSKTN